MKTIAPGIQQWSFFSQEKQLDFNGLLLTVNDHCILVDPPPMEAADRAAILKGHAVDYILLTNRDHVREAEACRRDFKAKVYAPEADAPLMELPVDKTYKDGELLPGGLWVIHLKDMKSPGESALLGKRRVNRILAVLPQRFDSEIDYIQKVAKGNGEEVQSVWVHDLTALPSLIAQAHSLEEWTKKMAAEINRKPS